MMCLFSTRASATLGFVSVMWDVIQWVCLRLRYNQGLASIAFIEQHSSTRFERYGCIRTHHGYC